MLFALRAKYKAEFADRLEEIKKTKILTDCMQFLNLSEYELKVAKKNDKDQLLNCLAIAFSFLGKNSSGEIFRSTPQEMKLKFSDKCDHIINTGTMLILKNKKTSEIIAGVGMLDLYDSKYKYAHSEPLPLSSQHRIECRKMDKNALYETKHKYLDALLEIKYNLGNRHLIDFQKYYGKWCEATLNNVLPEFRRRRISGFLNIILNDIIYSLGYKFRFYSISNPRAIANFVQSPNDEIIARAPNAIDYTMKDGTKISKYFEELETKWNYNSKDVEKLKTIHRCYAVAPTAILGVGNYLEYQLTALIRNKSRK